MDLFQLKYFVTIVEEGSISAAARKLHMSQPPLSLQIKNLEKEFNISLFTRDSRNLVITDEGKELYRRAKAMLDLASVTSKEIEAMSRGSSGILRLGTASSVGYTDVRKKILDFHLKHPDLSYSVHEKNTYSLIDDLIDGHLDVAFVRTPFPQAGFKCINLKEEDLVAIGNKSYFDTPDQTVSVSWLKNKPCIVYRRWEALIQNSFHEQGQPFSPLCICDDARTCVGWAFSGFGIALVPKSALEPYQISELSCHEITDLGIRSNIMLIMREDSANKIAKEFFAAFA